MIAALVIATLLTSIGIANLILRRIRHIDDDPLIERIDQLLPQTQCAQCGYPGCRPYAEALACGEAATNLCAPGGAPLMARLIELVEHTAATDIAAPPVTHQARAFIREEACIGCGLCLPPCPVDAIVGGPGFMYTVITDACTGCELCVPACPVDCIDMVNDGHTDKPERKIIETAPVTAEGHQPCIKCGACLPVCPVALPVQALLETVALQKWAQAEEMDLHRCIECGLCDDVCPSHIPLAEHFATGKEISTQLSQDAAQRERLKQRYEQHVERLASARERKVAKRSARLNQPRSW